MKTNAFIPALAIAIAVSTVGCDRDAEARSEGKTAAASPPVAVVPADPGPAAAAATAGAPLALAEAEALAEDVQTDLSAGAWPAAQAKARGLAASQQKLAALGTAPEKLAPIGDALDSLNAAIARQSRPDALTAANRISRGLNVVMAAYPSKVPIAVAEMDVAGRDALYAAEQGRWDAAAAAVTECRHTYAAVQNHVKGRDPGLDRKISGELGQMEQAVALRDGRRLATLSQALLDDVDKVELTY